MLIRWKEVHKVSVQEVFVQLLCKEYLNTTLVVNILVPLYVLTWYKKTLWSEVSRWFSFVHAVYVCSSSEEWVVFTSVMVELLLIQQWTAFHFSLFSSPLCNPRMTSVVFQLCPAHHVVNDAHSALVKLTSGKNAVPINVCLHVIHVWSTCGCYMCCYMQPILRDGLAEKNWSMNYEQLQKRHDSAFICCMVLYAASSAAGELLSQKYSAGSSFTTSGKSLLFCPDVLRALLHLMVLEMMHIIFSQWSS